MTSIIFMKNISCENLFYFDNINLHLFYHSTPIIMGSKLSKILKEDDNEKYGIGLFSL